MGLGGGRTRSQLWAHYDEEQERARRAAEAAAAAATREQPDAPVELVTLVPTEAVAANQFYAQIMGDGVKQLETLMSEFARFHVSAATPGPFTPKVGELVSAQFVQDRQWCGLVHRMSGLTTRHGLTCTDIGSRGTARAACCCGARAVLGTAAVWSR